MRWMCRPRTVEIFHLAAFPTICVVAAVVFLLNNHLDLAQVLFALMEVKTSRKQNEIERRREVNHLISTATVLESSDIKAQNCSAIPPRFDVHTHYINHNVVYITHNTFDCLTRSYNRASWTNRDLVNQLIILAKQNGVAKCNTFYLRCVFYFLSFSLEIQRFCFFFFWAKERLKKIVIKRKP